MGMSSIMKNIEDTGAEQKSHAMGTSEAMRKVGSLMITIDQANLRWKFKGQSWKEKLNM